MASDEEPGCNESKARKYYFTCLSMVVVVAFAKRAGCPALRFSPDLALDQQLHRPI